MTASQHTGHSPEGISNDSQVRRRSGREWIEGFVVVSGPGRHGQSAVRAEGITKSIDQAFGSSLDGTDGTKGGVYQQDTAFPDPEPTELLRYLGSPQRCSMAGRYTFDAQTMMKSGMLISFLR